MVNLSSDGVGSDYDAPAPNIGKRAEASIVNAKTVDHFTSKVTIKPLKDTARSPAIAYTRQYWW